MTKKSKMPELTPSLHKREKAWVKARDAEEFLRAKLAAEVVRAYCKAKKVDDLVLAASMEEHLNEEGVGMWSVREMWQAIERKYA